VSFVNKKGMKRRQAVPTTHTWCTQTTSKDMIKVKLGHGTIPVRPIMEGDTFSHCENIFLALCQVRDGPIRGKGWKNSSLCAVGD